MSEAFKSSLGSNQLEHLFLEIILITRHYLSELLQLSLQMEFLQLSILELVEAQRKNSKAMLHWKHAIFHQVIQSFYPKNQGWRCLWHQGDLIDWRAASYLVSAPANVDLT